ARGVGDRRTRARENGARNVHLPPLVSGRRWAGPLIDKTGDTIMLSKTAIAISALVLSAAAASPALSATSKTRVATPALSYAQVNGMSARLRHSTTPSHDVFVRGQYVGSDPDPFIRSPLARDTDCCN